MFCHETCNMLVSDEGMLPEALAEGNILTKGNMHATWQDI